MCDANKIAIGERFLDTIDLKEFLEAFLDEEASGPVTVEGFYWYLVEDYDISDRLMGFTCDEYNDLSRIIPISIFDAYLKKKYKNVFKFMSKTIVYVDIIKKKDCSE